MKWFVLNSVSGDGGIQEADVRHPVCGGCSKLQSRSDVAGRDGEEEESTHVDGAEDDGGGNEETEAESRVWAWFQFWRNTQRQPRKRGSIETVFQEFLPPHAWCLYCLGVFFLCHGSIWMFPIRTRLQLPKMHVPGKLHEETEWIQLQQDGSPRGMRVPTVYKGL